MLKHTKGNLLDLAEQGLFDFIVQGCNCFCTMGSGIAKEIRSRYPGAWRVDQNSEEGDICKLGTWSEYDTGDFSIINAYTQYGFNRPGSSSDVFEYASFEVILKKLAHLHGNCHFGFPYIGMGLAGGDKVRIIELLENFAKEVATKGGSVTLVEFQ